MSDSEFQRDFMWRTETGVGLYVLLTVIAVILLLMEGGSFVKAIYYHGRAVRAECSVNKDVVYFTAEDGKDYYIGVIRGTVWQKDGRGVVYYLPGKEQDAIVISRLWWHPFQLLVYGILCFVGVRGIVRNRGEIVKRRQK